MYDVASLTLDQSPVTGKENFACCDKGAVVYHFRQDIGKLFLGWHKDKLHPTMRYQPTEVVLPSQEMSSSGGYAKFPAKVVSCGVIDEEYRWTLKVDFELRGVLH